MKRILLLLGMLLSLKFLTAQYLGTGHGTHAIVVKGSGSVFTWGDNLFSQLGNGNTGTNSAVPVAVVSNGVLNGKILTKVATGFLNSIVLSSDGLVFTWGNNNYGQLGNGNTGTARNVPVAVSTAGVLNGKTVTQISAGSSHNVALSSEGKVYTWGNNTSGQLGNGNTGTDRNVPVAVSVSGVLSGKTIIQVAGGGYHTIALASDGTVYTWGDNAKGQLGNGNTGTDRDVPVAVSVSGVLSGKTIIQVAAGWEYSVALASDGTVYTWGDNAYGQLGNGNTGTDRNVPVAVSVSGVLSGKTITQIAAGGFHTLALASDGRVYTWGYNNVGQLGNGNTGTDRNVPVAVSVSGVLSGKTISQIAGGRYNSMALGTDGFVYTWGSDNAGTLGNNVANTDSNVPVAVFMGLIVNLPLQWNGFTAKIQNSQVVLDWSTVQEQNSKDLIVQHSTNGEYWKEIGIVAAAGNSSSIRNYNFTHKNPVEGNNFYRILQRGLDNNQSFSEIKSVKFTNKQSIFSLNSQTILNNRLILKIHTASTITMYSYNGDFLWTKNFTEGTHAVEISNYAKGIYFLRAGSQITKLMVQ